MANRSELVFIPEKPEIYYSDLDQNLSINPLTKQLALVNNENDITKSIIRLVNVAPFETEYQSDGAGVYKFLFELPDVLSAMAIKDSIEKTINNSEPRCILQSVDVTPYQNQSQWVATITYKTKNNPQTVTFNVILERII